jgi:hypothetical protein
MNSRRTFFRQLLAGAAVGLGFKAEGLARAQTVAAGREVPKGFFWKTTIFCQVEDSHLMSEIGLTAHRLGCDIWHGEPVSSDLIAVPYFVAIVDRRVVDMDIWHDFLEYRRESGDRTPCILVDTIWYNEDIMPIDEHMEFMHSQNQEGLRKILDCIAETHQNILD